MKGMIKVVPVRDDLREHIYERKITNAQDGTITPEKRKMYYLEVNEIPTTPGEKVNMWQIAIFNDNRVGKIDARDVEKSLMRNFDKFKAGTHYLQLDVEVRPQQKRSEDGQTIISHRNGIGGLALRGAIEIVEANEEEQKLLRVAFEAKDLTETD